MQFSAEVALMGKRRTSLKILNFVQAFCRLPSHDQRRGCTSSLSQEDPSSKPSDSGGLHPPQKAPGLFHPGGILGAHGETSFLLNETFPV